MLYSEDYDPISDSIIEQISIRDDNMDHVEYRIVRKDGTIRWVDDYGHYIETDTYGGVYFVFISDITEKRAKREQDDLVRDSVVEAFTNAYNTVLLINDIENATCTIFHSDHDPIHDEAIRNTLNFTKYTDMMLQYVETMVAKEDQERLREELSIPHIMKQFSEHDRFSVTFIRRFESGNRYYRVEFSKVRMPGGRTGVAMGFLDVDDEILKERSYIQAIQDVKQEQERRRQELDSMITALASDYRSVYHVNLDRDDGVCYRADNNDPDQSPVGVHFPFSKRFTYYANRYVTDEYREGFLKFIDPKNIREALAREEIIAYRYLANRDGRKYYEMIRMAGVRHAEDRDDHIVHAVGVGLTVIDAEMCETWPRTAL